MSLFFDWKSLKEKNKGFTFDDVLIVPKKSEVRSRKIPTLESSLTKNIKIQTPLISANMDTVTEFDMALAMNQTGAFGILHRFMSIEDQVSQVQRL
ncbi:MAG TPA: IMP dehydrogenase, partial [Pseudobdellovibrionaceae bacterium]|nr:IMP dehydrogenase [Pseudobdellovibrionaceae bacterium]